MAASQIITLGFGGPTLVPFITGGLEIGISTAVPKRQLTAGDLSYLRTRQQATDWYMLIHKPTALYSGTLAQTPQTHPVSAISLTGTTSQIKAGMTIWFSAGATTASDLGTARVRRDQSGGVVPIMESGSGLINWGAINKVFVMDLYEPITKHPRYNTSASQWLVDYDEGYNSQLEGYGPYVNIGPPVVVVGTGKKVVYFHASCSLFWDSAESTYLWEFPDGQTVSSGPGTPEVPIAMTFTNASSGGRYFTLTATDQSGASHIARRLIFKIDDFSQAREVAMGDIEGGILTGGYTTQFTTWGAPTSVLNDRAEIVIFENASYGNTGTSVGGNYAHRENIVFRGWLTGPESINVNPFTSNATLTAKTIHGILSQQDTYDVFLANYSAGASQWVEASMLSLDRAAMYMLKHRATAAELVDFYPMSGIGLSPISFQSLVAPNFWDQLRQNYHEKGVLGFIAADLQSSLHAFDDAQVSGASPLLVVTLDEQDIAEQVTIVRDTADEVSKADLYGIVYGGNPTGASDSPVGAQSPGDVAGYYGRRQEVTQGLQAPDQNTLTTWAGNYRAKLNNPLKQVSIPLIGNWKVDSVPQGRIRMSLAASRNARGLNWSNKDFLLTGTRMSLLPDVGYVLTTLQAEALTHGIGGSAITFPAIQPLPTADPPTIPSIPSAPPITAGGGFGTAYVAGRNKLFRTRDLSATTPTWTEITPAGVGDSVVHDFILDPWSPGTTGFLTTDTKGIFRSTDLENTTPTWTQVLTPTAAANKAGRSPAYRFGKIVGSINQQGYFICMFFAGAFGNGTDFAYVAITGDSGDTWSVARIGSGDTDGQGFGIDVVQHPINNSLMVYAAWRAQGGQEKLFKSTDRGFTWSEVYNDGSKKPPGAMRDPDTVNYVSTAVHCPYNNNTSGSKVFITFWNGQTGGDGHGYVTTSDTTLQDLGTTLDSKGYSTRAKRTGVESYTQNEDLIYLWRPITPTGGKDTFCKSTNGGSTFTEISVTGTNGVSGDVYATGGFPYNSDQYYVVTTSGVYVSIDGGITFSDKTGDIPANALSGLSMGMGTVVPLWTE